MRHTTEQHWDNGCLPTASGSSDFSNNKKDSDKTDKKKKNKKPNKGKGKAAAMDSAIAKVNGLNIIDLPDSMYLPLLSNIYKLLCMPKM